MVSQYAMHVLDTLLISLRLAADDHPSLGTVQASAEAVDHMERILVHWCVVAAPAAIRHVSHHHRP